MKLSTAASCLNVTHPLPAVMIFIHIISLSHRLRGTLAACFPVVAVGLVFLAPPPAAAEDGLLAAQSNTGSAAASNSTFHRLPERRIVYSNTAWHALLVQQRQCACVLSEPAVPSNACSTVFRGSGDGGLDEGTRRVGYLPSYVPPNLPCCGLVFFVVPHSSRRHVRGYLLSAVSAATTPAERPATTVHTRTAAGG